MTAARLSPPPVDAIVDVMADAFAGYPVMRFVVGETADVEARERALVGLFVRRRLARGGPAFGVSVDGALEGAAILTLPREPAPPPEVAEMAVAAWLELGDAARRRYDAYASAASLFDALPPHHHLNMIGVRPARKGSGLARPLLDAVIALASADAESAGVSLTTEVPRNVELYRHFGFEVVGEADVAPGLHTWGMFRVVR